MLNSLIYQEFTIPLKDYFNTLKINEFIFDWIIPIIFATAFYFSEFNGNNLGDVSVFIGSVISLLAILVGFSIASATILLSSDNENITLIKKNVTNRKLDDKNISLYHLIYITFIAAILIEIFVLFFNLGIYFSFEIIGILLNYKRILISLDIVFLLNIFLLNIRNITNFYFVFYPKGRVSD
jgi:hypothetical protein